MPIGIGAGTAIAGIVGGGAALASGALQSHAAGNAADLNTQAANHAADVQAQSARDALAFQRQQAAQDFNNAQAASRGNYDQWAARQGRLSTLGQMVGQKPFVIPAYVPMQQAPDAPQQQANPQANQNLTTMGQAFLRQPNGPGGPLQRPVLT